MTEATAQKIFFALFNSLRENSFEEVGTWLLRDKDNVFYENSTIAFQQLYISAQNPENAKNALRQTLSAAIGYFSSAQQLSEKFQNEFEKIPSERPLIVPRLVLFGDENEIQTIDITQRLKNESLEEFIHIVTIIQEHFQDSDEELFRILNILS